MGDGVDPQKNKSVVGWLCQFIENKVVKKKTPIYRVKPWKWGKPLWTKPRKESTMW